MGGMTRLLLLLLAGVTVSTAMDLHKRILGGQQCDRTYHVRIVYHDGGLICGGSLISNTWILTAAHCWNLVMFAVIPGERQTINIVAPPVMFSDEHGVHDIMLLQLGQPAGNAQIALPNCSSPLRRGDSVQIAGHGAATTGRNNQRINVVERDLHCANITYMPCGDTQTGAVRRRPQARSEHWFCGNSTRTDVSEGDSGGGVVMNDMIYGVISATGNGTFAFAAPAIFMDVCGYINWIRNVTGI